MTPLLDTPSGAGLGGHSKQERRKRNRIEREREIKERETKEGDFLGILKVEARRSEKKS